MAQKTKPRCARRISDGRGQVAMEGVPPAVICSSLQEALGIAVGISPRDMSLAEMCRLDTRGHVLDLIELGMTEEHIAESADVSCDVVDAIIAGNRPVSKSDIDALGQVEFQLSEVEATALDIMHFTAMGATLREAIMWCRKRDGLSAQKAWAAVPIVKQRMKGLMPA